MGSIDQRDVMSLKLLKIHQVCERTALGRSTVYAKVAAKLFPKPVKTGPRAVAWVETEIEAWIREQIEASRGGHDEPK